MNIISITIDTSSADFVRKVLISCGKNAIVVNPAAIYPYVSGELIRIFKTEVSMIPAV